MCLTFPPRHSGSSCSRRPELTLAPAVPLIKWQSAKAHKMDGVTDHRAIVDTHRHPVGPKLRAKMAERGLYDPNEEFQQANAQDLICYREFFDLGLRHAQAARERS